LLSTPYVSRIRSLGLLFFDREEEQEEEEEGEKEQEVPVMLEAFSLYVRIYPRIYRQHLFEKSSQSAPYEEQNEGKGKEEKEKEKEKSVILGSTSLPIYLSKTEVPTVTMPSSWRTPVM
jgi:hypothetical protein